MPGFQACPGIASFEMLYGCLSQNCENVYHVKSDTPWDAASLTVIGDEFLNWESTIACNSRHLSCALFNIHCRDLTTAAGAEIDVAPPSPVPGTNPGTPLPNNVTIAVKWVTGVAGRSFRGRTFHLGLAENQFIGNTLNGATAAGLVTAYGGLITAISSHPGKSLVVLSRRTGTNPRPAGIGTAIIRPILVDLALDSQRRRLLNHNRHR